MHLMHLNAIPERQTTCLACGHVHVSCTVLGSQCLERSLAQRCSAKVTEWMHASVNVFSLEHKLFEGKDHGCLVPQSPAQGPAWGGPVPTKECVLNEVSFSTVWDGVPTSFNSKSSWNTTNHPGKHSIWPHLTCHPEKTQVKEQAREAARKTRALSPHSLLSIDLDFYLH